MIADVVKKDSGQLTLSTSNGDSVITIGGGDSNPYCEIKNYGKDENKRGYASDDSLYTMRMDFADYVDSGIDAFVNNEAKTMKEYGGIVEDIAVEMQYKDKLFAFDHNYPNQ